MSSRASERSERSGEGGPLYNTIAVSPRSATAYLTDAASVFRLFLRCRRWLSVCLALDVVYPAKRFVYIIRSVNHPQKRYIGVTSDVAARVSAHNAGQNRSTARWRPWGIDVTIEFRTERMLCASRST